MSEPTIAIYCGTGCPKDLNVLAGSKFNAVILNSLHFRDDGSLYLNGSEYVDADQVVQPAAIEMGSALQSLGDGVSKRLSIGGGGNPPIGNGIQGIHSVSDNDFKALATAYWGYATPENWSDAPILTGLGNLVDALGVDVIDLDPEPFFYSYEQVASMMVLLTRWAQNVANIGVTWTPYTNTTAWGAIRKLTSAASLAMPTGFQIQPNGWNNTASDLTQWTEAFDADPSQIVLGFTSDSRSSNYRSLMGIMTTLAKVIEALPAGESYQGAYLWNQSNQEEDPSLSNEYAAIIYDALTEV